MQFCSNRKEYRGTNLRRRAYVRYLSLTDKVGLIEREGDATGAPKPATFTFASPRFAGCSTRFIHEFHFHGHGHGHAIRVATVSRSPPLRFVSFRLPRRPGTADREKTNCAECRGPWAGRPKETRSYMYTYLFIYLCICIHRLGHRAFFGDPIKRFASCNDLSELQRRALKTRLAPLLCNSNNTSI